MSVAVVWITEMAAFASLAAEWEALMPADARPFDLHCWYLAWWRAFGKDDRLEVCTVRREGRLVGALPLSRRDSDSHLVGMANAHSGTFRPLAVDDAAMDALLAAAVERGPRLELDELPEADPWVERLSAATRRGGAIPLFQASDVSPIVDTSGDLDVWNTTSHPTWKARLRRYRRKMERDHEAELSIVEPPADLASELEEGFRVEASGWKGEAGSAILSAPETEAFYREVAEVFHERGELRLNRIVLDGKLAAFSLCLRHRQRLYSLKAGFDESFRKLMPGLVLQLSICERCFETDVEAYELLGNRSDWKEHLATDERPLLSFRSLRRTPAGAAVHAYRTRLRPAARRVYRRLRPAS